jgi:inosose dehydratase
VTNIRLAINPLQWLATDDGWLDFGKAPPLTDALEKTSRAGFDAVMADVPAGMTVLEYRDLLTRYDTVPAPGYFSGALEDPDRRDELVREAARRAEVHRDLSLSEMFVAARMSPESPRVARPARGLDADDRRLAEIAETLTRIGSATRERGVTACLHQHVGSWIESGPELEWLLERLDPDVVALGPDTGHLAWAGIDPVEFVRRHRDRVRALHVKDIRQGVADAYRQDGKSYREVIQAGLWVEPGRGDIDLRAIFDDLRGGACRWAIVEVDSPDLPTPDESIAFCGTWARSAAAW